MLRPHHLLCVLTYIGKGYSPEFAENMTAVSKRLSSGEAIRIVEGPDEICAPLLTDDNAHCLNGRVPERDRHAASDLTEVFGTEIKAGATLRLTPVILNALREAFAQNRIRRGCDFCQWHELCDQVAKNNFQGAAL